MGTSSSLEPEALASNENANDDPISKLTDEEIDARYRASLPSGTTKDEVLEAIEDVAQKTTAFVDTVRELVATEPKPVVPLEIAKTMTSTTDTPVENIIDTVSSPGLTFSWERESVQVFLVGHRGDRNILAFYLPAEWEETAWWEVIRGENATEDFAAFQKFNRDDTAWVELLHRCAMGAAFQYIQDNAISWGALKRASYAPPHFSEKLAEENNGAEWEVHSAWAVESLDLVVEHICQLETLCSDKPLEDPLAHAEGKSYHIHVAFRRPAMKNAARKIWADNLTALTFLLNDYGCLRMYQWGTIGKKILGPFPQMLSDWLRTVLTFRRLRRGPGVSLADGALEETTEGHNEGPVKWAATALRQTYKPGPGATVDPEILGFEFRAWRYIRPHLEHIGRVAGLLRTVDLTSIDAQVALGDNKPYRLSALLAFEHTSGMQQLDVVFAGHQHPREFVMKVLQWGVDNSEFDLDQCAMMLERILYPFLKWDQHPAVIANDPSGGTAIREATAQLLRQFGLYAIVIAACDGEDEIPGKDEEGEFDDVLRALWSSMETDKELASLVQSGEALPKARRKSTDEPAAQLILIRAELTRNPYELLQSAVNDWAEATEIWRWF